MFHTIILYSSATLWFFVTDVRTGIHTTSIPWLAGKDLSGRTAPSYAKQPRCHWPQTSSGRCAPIGEHLPWVRRHGMSPLIGGWCVCVRALPTTTPSSKKINPGWWLRYEAHPKSQDIPSRIILEYFGGTLGSPSGNISASGCLSSAPPAPGAGVKNVALYNWKSRAFWSYLYLNILNRTN